MRPQLSINARQQLLLSQKMQEALRILQMNHLQLKEFLDEEIEKNPLLEWDPGFIAAVPLPDYEIAAKESVFDSLRAQAREAFKSKEELQIAETIISNIDEKGFLTSPLENSEKVLSIIHTFEPIGIGSRNIQECLLLQLKAKGKEKALAYQIIQKNFPDLLKGRIHFLLKLYNISKDEWQTVVLVDLKPLSLQPIASRAEPVSYLYPDLFIRKEEQSWIVEVGDDLIPHFKIRKEYQFISESEKSLMRGYLAKGNWLMRSLNRRRKMLLQIGLYIVKKQKSFLDGKGPLYPLTVKEIASELRLHPSTVARACQEKTIATPFGIKPLRFFLSQVFKNQTSTKAAMAILEKLLEKENNPLSDRELAEKMKELGVPCARRTVAKYRQKLRHAPKRVRLSL